MRIQSKKVEGPPPLWDLYRDGVTQGLIGNFLACPERARLGLKEGLSSTRGSGPLAFGSLVHDVLDKVYSAIREEVAGGDDISADSVVELSMWHLSEMEKVKKQEIYDTISPDPSALNNMEENFGTAEIIVEYYFRRWITDLKSFDWMSLEEVFNVPYSIPENVRDLVQQRTGREIPLTIPVRGKFDGIFRATKKLWLFETKTKARIEDTAIVDTLSYNLQVCLYLWAVRQTYDEVPSGVLYNLIRRPQLRRGKTESLPIFLNRVHDDVRDRPDHYFARYHARIMTEEQDAWMKDFHGMMTQVILWNEGFFHFKNQGSCSDRFGSCLFLPICSRGEYSYVKKREHVFPELV